MWLIILVLQTCNFFRILQVLDSNVFHHQQQDDESDQSVNIGDPEQVDDACVLYCERFMEFLIDLLSQLPTRR